MYKNLLFAFLMLFAANTIFAQEAQITGNISDNAAKTKLAQASISVLQAKDSILVKFTRTNAEGVFNFNNIANGDYILLVTYPEYADYVEKFQISESIKKKNFGEIDLLLKARLLQEVIVKGDAVAMRVKGDTTEFNAGSFKVQPNAKVEDLLKQLPGIQVDADGKITAQGETVNRVLVDGEEFFGDDPTLVTKNIRSDMVDKVQLYDDKSENAKFTGIDDGQRSKTINLKLKEDKKKGYFGKLDAGGGNSDFFSTQALFNVFDNKKKLSLYSTIGNTKRTGLDWESARKYGTSGGEIEINDDGGVNFYFNDYDQFSSENFNGEGIPEIVNTGIHFENKWNEDKHALNLDVKYGRLNNVGNKFDLFQNNLPNNFQNNNSALGFDNLLNQQKTNGAYEFKIDTSSNLKISFDNTFKNTNNSNNTVTSGFRNTTQLINTGTRDFSNEGQDHKLNTSLFYGKRFKKPGRTLTFRFNQSYFNNNSDGLLQATNTFYNAEQEIDSIDVINQSKLDNQVGDSYKTSLTFTEKLSKTFSVTSNYDFGYNKVNSELKSFNANSNGEYVDLDTRFSNDLDYRSNTHQGGLAFNYKKDKTSVTVGSKVAFANLLQLNLLTNSRFERDFTNFIPKLNYTYSFSKQSAFRLDYTGNTQQPSVNQLQPVLSNNNPLNIVIGNPDLDIAFSNRITTSYNSYKVLSSRSIWGYISYNFTSNPIVSDVTTDQAGKSISTFINIKNATPSNFSTGTSIGGKIGKTKMYWNTGVNANGNTFYNLINKELNKSNSYSFSPTFQISEYQDKYSFYISLNPGYRINSSSLQPQQNSNGKIFNSRGSFSYKLPQKVTVALDYNYEFQEKTTAFNTNFDRLIVNSSIFKTFLKSDNLKIALSGNDILNQNVGFRRSAFGNTISQSSFTNIQRYFLFSVVWDFSKFGTLKTSN